MPEKELKIEYIDPSRLELAKYNPRNISENELNGLIASIERFGIVDPLVVNVSEGILRLVGGHQRCKAAIKAGIKKVPIVKVELNSSEEKALNLTLNNQEISGNWDTDKLKIILEEVRLELPQIEFKELNLPELELSIFGEQMEEPKAGDNDPDEVPDVKETVIQVGDLVWLGNHKILCGDSCKKEDVERVMGGEEADIIVYDPPYDVDNIYSHIPPSTQGARLIVFWDFKRFGVASYEAISKGWEPMYEFIWDNCTSWYTPNRPLARHKACGVFGDDAFFDLDNAIIHDGKTRKSHTVTNTRGSYNYQALPEGKHISTVEQFPNTDKLYKHSKPIKWITAIMGGLRGDLVFDMFSGSGTTIIACEEIRKHSFNIDNDPCMVQMAIQRYLDYTGEKQIIINNETVIWEKLIDCQ